MIAVDESLAVAMNECAISDWPDGTTAGSPEAEAPRQGRSAGRVCDGSRRRRGAWPRESLGPDLYAFRIEPHWVEIVRPRSADRRAAGRHGGKTLLQLSDLHIGPIVDDAYLIGIAAASRSRCSPTSWSTPAT